MTPNWARGSATVPDAATAPAVAVAGTPDRDAVPVGLGPITYDELDATAPAAFISNASTDNGSSAGVDGGDVSEPQASA